MISFKHKPTSNIIIIMILLVAIALIYTSRYYSKINESIDPRIVNARELYKEYNILTIENRFLDIFSLLDSIEDIYRNVKHYENSYEIGVIHNNRTATYLTLALLHDSLVRIYYPLAVYSKDSLIGLAQSSVIESIKIYKNWLVKYDSISEDEILEKIQDTFMIGLEDYDDRQKAVYLKARIKDMVSAQYENKRRLSVCYTNYGVIRRYYKDYTGAVLYYKNAIELWDRNLAAENNLNKLLGKPLKKRNILQKMFPPEKDNN